MKTTTTIALSMLAITKLAFAVEVTPLDRANKIPSITESEIAILSKSKNTKIQDGTAVTYEDKLIKSKLKKYDYKLATLLKTLEDNHNKFDKEKVFIVPQKQNEKIFITEKQYSDLSQERDIKDFIRKLNSYTNMTFTTKELCSADGNKKIIYVVDITRGQIPDQIPVDYVLLEKTKDFYRNNNMLNEDCDDFQKAFDYFRTHQGYSNKKLDFNLDAIELMSLYIKLARWNVDLGSVNPKLLELFAGKAQYIKNFDFDKAFMDLKYDPSYTVANNIKKDLLELKHGFTYDASEKEKSLFVYKEPMYLSSILKEVSLVDGSKYYLDSFFSRDVTIPLPIGKVVTIKSIDDLKKYLHDATKYEIKIETHKYLKHADKKVLLVLQRDVRHQALHYLDSAIADIRKVDVDTLAKEALIDDIKAVKKEY